MENTVSVITGSELVSDITSKELKILIQFYKAFNQCDMNLMQLVWFNSKESSMNNPLGGIMRDWDEIRSVYNRIFTGEATVYVEFFDFTLHVTENMFFATGRERGYVEMGNERIDLAIRTSRIFIKCHNEWKQIQHHGSIDNPNLLKKYQQAILK